MPISAKILLLGDGSVGKTSLRDKYLKKEFTTNYLPTLGADFATKSTLIRTSLGWKELKFQIWDLAGQPTFKQIRGMYYRGAVGAMLIYDVTRANSLYNLEHWMEEMAKNVLSLKVALCILGNKIDLRSESSVSFEVAKSVIHENIEDYYDHLDDNITHLETSAKTGENVDRAFHTLGEKIMSMDYIRRSEI